MSNVRIIARLDIKGPNLVKGVHLEGLRVLGRPELFAPRYYHDGADELIYIDLVASLYQRNNLTEIVKRAAENIYIPLTVGGGIRSVRDIYNLLRAGADKVAINTAAIGKPKLIREAARVFGSQCIVVSIQAIKRGIDRYECLVDNARERSGVDVYQWAKQVTDLGAGEILLTSIDQEGTGQGYDIYLTRRIAEMVPIPVIAHGGAGSMDHVIQVIREGKADAVSAASIFHYGVVAELVGKSDYAEEGNIEFLRQNLPIRGYRRKCITPVSFIELKKKLIEAGISCRLPDVHQDKVSRQSRYFEPVGQTDEK